MTTFFIVIVYVYSKTTSALVQLLTRRIRNLDARSADHRDIAVQKGPMSALAASLQRCFPGLQINAVFDENMLSRSEVVAPKEVGRRRESQPPSKSARLATPTNKLAR
jgi:hypothetical protein